MNRTIGRGDAHGRRNVAASGTEPGPESASAPGPKPVPPPAAPAGRAHGAFESPAAAALLASALDVAAAGWGCVWRVVDGRPAELAAMLRRDGGAPATAEIGRDTDAAPDRTFELAIERAEPLFLNRHSHGTLDGLPRGHPPIGSFALVPCRDGDRVAGLLFVANAERPFVLAVLNRLQGLADAHARGVPSGAPAPAPGRDADDATDAGGDADDADATDPDPADPDPAAFDAGSALDALDALDPGAGAPGADDGRPAAPSGVRRPARDAAFERLFAASLNGVLRTDEHGLITRVNPAAEEVFGIVEIAVLGTPVQHLFAAGTLQRLEPDARRRRALERDGHVEVLRGEAIDGRRSDDAPLRLEVSAYQSLDAGRASTTLVIDDISDHVESARELQVTLAQQQALMRLAPIGIVQLGADWRCLYANDMWCRLSRLTLDESLGNGWIDSLHPEDVVETLETLRETLSRFETFEREVRLHSPLGETRWVNMNASAMLTASERMTGTLIVFNDITERRRTDERLRRIAHHDALTGLLNRTFFLDRLSQALHGSERRGEVALLMLDLDGFKAVNDTLGHDHGDELLRQVAARLLETVRSEDTVARLGGDEFTVTLTHLDGREQAGGVAAKIVARLREPFLIKGQEVFISASVGIATGNSHGTDVDTLIKQADVALYRAKGTGRSRHVYFTPELDQARRERSTLVTSLRRAVERDEFELHYQPQLLIGEQRLLGFEALLRWPEAPEGVTTQHVVDALEEAGLVGEVGDWAIAEAVRARTRWHEAGLVEPEVTMSVNVSVRQLGAPGFAERVAATLEREAMPPERLVLEITESALVETFETGVLGELKRLGVGISLDDFGTGYSSLAYLGQLPLDHLKIDRSFILDMARRPQAVTIVKSIIALARTLGIEVVAEGVEDARVLPLLADEGCNAYQGFQFSHPLAAPDVEALLAALDPLRLGHVSNFVDLGDDRPPIGER